MSYERVQHYDDPYAKGQIRDHSISGANIIDILYEAKNPDGTPKEPEKGDGHGHFSAMEIDGMYQMINWRHPDSEGGYHEYGDYKDERERKNIFDNGADRKHHPLMDLEADIKEKHKILNEIRQLMKDRNYDPAAVEAKLAGYEGIFDMNTPEEQKIKRQINELAEKHKRRIREQEQNKERKCNLISQAQGLLHPQDWKKASAQMKDLMNHWKETGYAGPDNDLLWKEFQEARQTFYQQQHKHYEELEDLRKQRKRQKEEIISEAGSITQCVTNWKSAHENLEEMLSRWKKVGSAGKEDDERLWAEFQKIRNDFYARKKEAEEKRESEFLTKRQAKSNLILEAQSYAKNFDYSPSAADRMKKISGEWKAIGFCGKEYDEQLWSQFRMAMDAYWQGKKSSGEEKHRAWVARTQEAITRRKRRIYNIQRNIDNLRDRLYTTFNYDKQNQIYGWISENESQIRELEEEIDRMERELWK